MKEERKKVERFTEDQLALSNSIQSLLRFYYSVDREKINEKKLTDSNRERIEAFLENTYGKILSRNNKIYQVKLPYVTKSKKTFISNIRSINYKHLKHFLLMMDQLAKEIANNNHIHVLLVGVTDRINSSIDTKKEQKVSYDISPDDSESEEIFFGPYPDEMKISIALVDNAIFKTIRNRSISGETENDLFFVRITHERQYTVMPTTDFGCLLLSLKSKDMFRTDPHFMSIWIDSIFQLITVILVQFHLAFDGFERIKVCKFCGRLFFEKKKGSKVYCSDTCRVKYSRSVEPSERRLCRER